MLNACGEGDEREEVIKEGERERNEENMQENAGHGVLLTWCWHYVLVALGCDVRSGCIRLDKSQICSGVDG